MVSKPLPLTHSQTGSSFFLWGLFLVHLYYEKNTKAFQCHIVSFIMSPLWMGLCLTCSMAIGVTEAESLVFSKFSPGNWGTLKCVLAWPSLKISIETIAFVSDVTVLWRVISQVSLRSINTIKQCSIFGVCGRIPFPASCQLLNQHQDGTWLLLLCGPLAQQDFCSICRNLKDQHSFKKQRAPLGVCSLVVDTACCSRPSVRALECEHSHRQSKEFHKCVFSISYIRTLKNEDKASEFKCGFCERGWLFVSRHSSHGSPNPTLILESP